MNEQLELPIFTENIEPMDWEEDGVEYNGALRWLYRITQDAELRIAAWPIVGELHFTERQTHTLYGSAGQGSFGEDIRETLLERGIRRPMHESLDAAFPFILGYKPVWYAPKFQII